MLALPPVPIAIRPLNNPDFQRLLAKYPTLPPTPGGKRCITCSGTGRFSWYVEDQRDFISEYECDCRGQWLLHLALLNANVGVTYQRLGWADMTATEEKAKQEVQNYLANSQGFLRAGVGMILFGTMGTGKTGLSVLLLKELLSQGVDCYFTTFVEMIEVHTSGWYDKGERLWFHKRIKNAGVLVIDDVGREYKGSTKTGLPESTFDEVLRHRVAASTPTIITTNKRIKALQEGYGGNVMSLLHERSATYEFRGEDFRDALRNRLADEVAAGLTRPVVLR